MGVNTDFAARTFDLPPRTLRRCYMCKRQLQIEQFTRDRHKSLGRSYRCQDCDRGRCRIYYQDDPERREKKRQTSLTWSRIHLGVQDPRICSRCQLRPAQSQRHHYCEACRSETDQARREREKIRNRARGRGTLKEQGYGADHFRRRKALIPLVATGQVQCARCFEFIAPGEPWDLGHDDVDRTRYSGPEHRRCNRATAGRQKRFSREW